MRRQAVIEMSGLKVFRGKTNVLDIKRLTITKGELVSVIGANGAGKSTLLQTINLLLPFEEGTFSLLGTAITAGLDLLSLRRRCALVFQEPLFIKDSVFENVALPLRFRKLPAKTIKEKVRSALETFRCSHLADRLAYLLSGGEAQRVCLARAFVSDPEILLLDEPFTALDPATRQSLLIELRREAECRNITAILISHNLSDILRFTNRTLVMEAGTIVQDAGPESVLRRPANLTVARLVGMDNIIPCRIEKYGRGKWLKLTDGIGFEWRQSDEVPSGFCCLPGDAFCLWNDTLSKDIPWVVLSAGIRQVIPGIGTYQTVAVADGLQLNMRISKEQAGKLRPGDTVKIAFNSLDAHVV